MIEIVVFVEQFPDYFKKPNWETVLYPISFQVLEDRQGLGNVLQWKSYEEEVVHPVPDPSQAEEGDEGDDEVGHGVAAANLAQVLEDRLYRFGSLRQLLANLNIKWTY